MLKKKLITLLLVPLLFILASCEHPQPVKQQHTTLPPPVDKTRAKPRVQQPPTQHTHVRNRPRPTVTSFQQIKMNPQQMLSAHNQVRSRYGLQPLTWSPALSAFSQKWANHLLSTRGCYMQHRPHSGRFKTDYGENLYWASPYRWSDGKTQIQNINARNVVHEWAKEVRYYNYKNNSCQAGQQCGHFKQIVWKNSRKVGCGFAVCPDKSQVWVCSYDPPGNWQGERPY